jgi:hypothetical protein
MLFRDGFPHDWAAILAPVYQQLSQIGDVRLFFGCNTRINQTTHSKRKSQTQSLLKNKILPKHLLTVGDEREDSGEQPTPNPTPV